VRFGCRMAAHAALEVTKVFPSRTVRFGPKTGEQNRIHKSRASGAANGDKRQAATGSSPSRQEPPLSCLNEMARPKHHPARLKDLAHMSGVASARAARKERD
jgi:hypothetical protein